MSAKFENSVVATGLGNVFIPISKKSNAKERSNYHAIVLMSPAGNVMFK